MNDGRKKAERAGASFEDRLAAARNRQGLDPKPAHGAGGRPLSPMGIGVRVGVDMLSAMIVGVALGYWLDRVFHTSPILLAIFVLLGGAGGVANVWRLLGPGKPGTNTNLPSDDVPATEMKDRHRGG